MRVLLFQPVHATGRYFYLSLVEILQREFGYPKVYSENSLLRIARARADLDLGPSCEQAGSAHLGADDHWTLLASCAHTLARVCAGRGQEGVRCTLLRRVSGGRGCGRPASAHGRSSDGIEYRA
jgi:hypothetical protein